MNKIKKRWLIPLVGVLVAATAVVSMAFLTDRQAKNAQISTATFSGDGYSLSRAVDIKDYMPGEVVPVVLTESNTMKDNIASEIETTLRWTSSNPDAGIFNNASAGDNVSIKIGNQSVAYEVIDANTAKLMIPKNIINSNAKPKRTLEITIPASTKAAGTLAFEFDKATIAQHPTGFSKEYDKATLNSPKDLSFSIKVTPEAPMLAERDSWYKYRVSAKQSLITEINIVDSYAPTGNELASWNADVDNTGSIKCYLEDSKLTIAGNGSGSIRANPDSTNAFMDFWSTEKINGLNLIDTQNTTEMRSMFGTCMSLTTLDLSGWDTNNVTIMRSMFNSCENLTSLNLGKWETAKVIDMEYMFATCPSLTNLDVRSWDTSATQWMDGMFNGCSALTTLDVSGWNISNLQSSISMFENCTSLTSLDLSGWSTNPEYDVHSELMFDGCTSLKELTIGAGIKDFTMFQAQNLPSLTKITFLHDAIDSQVEMPTAGAGTGAFYVDSFVDTEIISQNDIINSYDWAADNRAKTYSINYDVDGGTLPNDAPKTYTQFDEVILPTPTKQGYEFIGWTESSIPYTLGDYWEIAENGDLLVSDKYGGPNSGPIPYAPDGFWGLYREITFTVPDVAVLSFTYDYDRDTWNSGYGGSYYLYKDGAKIDSYTPSSNVAGSKKLVKELTPGKYQIIFEGYTHSTWGGDGVTGTVKDFQIVPVKDSTFPGFTVISETGDIQYSGNEVVATSAHGGTGKYSLEVTDPVIFSALLTEQFEAKGTTTLNIFKDHELYASYSGPVDTTDYEENISLYLPVGVYEFNISAALSRDYNYPPACGIHDIATYKLDLVDKIAKGSKGDRSFKALWSKTPMYSIAYDTDGGTIPADAPKYYTGDVDVALPKAKKTGSEFIGWADYGDILVDYTLGDYWEIAENGDLLVSDKYAGAGSGSVPYAPEIDNSAPLYRDIKFTLEKESTLNFIYEYTKGTSTLASGGNYYLYKDGVKIDSYTGTTGGGTKKHSSILGPGKYQIIFEGATGDMGETWGVTGTVKDFKILSVETYAYGGTDRFIPSGANSSAVNWNLTEQTNMTISGDTLKQENNQLKSHASFTLDINEPLLFYAQFFAADYRNPNNSVEIYQNDELYWSCVPDEGIENLYAPLTPGSYRFEINLGNKTAKAPDPASENKLKKIRTYKLIDTIPKGSTGSKFLVAAYLEDQAPMLAPQDSWYKGTTSKDAITQIDIVDSYTPTGAVTEQWDASDPSVPGTVTAYIEGTKLTLAGNGSGKIKANPNSSFAFSTSKLDQGSPSFSSVSKINNLSLLDTSAVTNMDMMFCGLNKVTSLDLSSWDTGCVTRMDYMFLACDSLTTLDLSSFDVSQVSSLSGMFKNCESLVSIQGMENWAINRLSSDTSMFDGCKSLTSIDLSNWEVGDFNANSFVIQNCESLTSVDMSNFGEVRNGTITIQSCPKLKELTIGANITDFSRYGFSARNLPSLSTITFLHGPNDVVQMAAAGQKTGAFYVGTNVKTKISTQNDTIKNYNWAADNRGMIEIANSWDISKNRDGSMIAYLVRDEADPTKYTLDIQGTGEMKDWLYMTEWRAPNADYVANITSITVGEGVTSVGKNAFYDFSSLKSISLPSTLTAIGDSAIRSCPQLAEITLPDSLKTIGVRAFESSGIANKIVLPSSIESIGKYAFTWTNITGADLSAATNLKTIEEAVFAECPNLAGDIVIPGNVTAIGKVAFAHNTGITGLDLSQAANLQTIGEGAFEKCTSLSSKITIPGTVTLIDRYAFNGTGIQGLDLSGAHALKTIATGAFVDCQFPDLYIPASVKDIQQAAFARNHALTKITFENGFNGSIYETTPVPEGEEPEGQLGENEYWVYMGAFYATKPYTVINLLPTTVITSSDVVKNYDWTSEHRDAQFEAKTLNFDLNGGEVAKENQLSYDLNGGEQEKAN